MTAAVPPKDLIVLAADKNAQFAIQGLLSRHQALGIRAIDAAIFVHPERDPGCLRKSDAFLTAFRRNYRHALVIFDREGCGQESDNRTTLEERVEAAMERTGWNRPDVATIVLDPELEAWVWSDSPQVDSTLGWQGQTPDLRTWLRANQYLAPDASKPRHPKQAMEAALRHVRRPRSSALFQILAESVSVQRCSDPAFEKLKRTLANWFAMD